MATLVTFFLVLGVLIIVHELGHYLTARLAGVKVLEFGLGYPPRLWSFTRGETRYSLNLVPLGGFVKLLGEEDPTDRRSLAAKPAWVRITVLAAGACMNALLPFFIFILIFALPHPEALGPVIVTGVDAGSPAAEAGLQSGDVMLMVGDAQIGATGDLHDKVQGYLGQPVTFTIRRNGQEQTVVMTPRASPPEGQGALGVHIDRETVNERTPFFQAIPAGIGRTVDTVRLIRDEVVSWVRRESAPQLSGPIGIAQLTGEVLRVGGVIFVLQLTAVLSINLAILNLLPIPALDGGRILFVVIEVIRRGKRIAPQKEAMAHAIGFAILIAAVLAISYNDLLRILRGQDLLR